MTLLQWEGWTRWPTEVPSNPYHSVILWKRRGGKIPERAGCSALGTEGGTCLTGMSTPHRKRAVVEILFYPTPGFPGSCPRPYGHPGCWERTVPAVVLIYVVEAKPLADPRGQGTAQNLSGRQARAVPATHVCSSHRPHRPRKRSSFLLSLCSPAVAYMSKVGRGSAFVLVARIESCFRPKSLKFSRPLCYFNRTIYSCPFSSVLPHNPLPFFQNILILLEVFSSSLLIAYITYLATTI